MASRLDRLRSRIESVRVFESARSRRRVAIHAAILLAALVVLTVLVRQYVPFLTDMEKLASFVRGFGLAGPIVLVVVQALQVVVAPVPGQVLAVVAGYLYGPWWGTLYSMIGITIGSAAAFWLSRRYGRPYVESVVHEDVLARFEAIRGRHVRVSLFVLFLFPGLPDDVLCFAGGLTRVPLWQLVVIAILGRAPAFLLVNFVGGFLEADRLPAALALGAAVLAASVLAFLFRDRLIGLLGRGAR